MAIDILSIAAMSSGTERLFSKSKLTVTDQRGAMDAETLNLVECLRSWDSSALIVPSDVSFLLHEDYRQLIAESSVAMSMRLLGSTTLMHWGAMRAVGDQTQWR
jgi:hypothetical protein